MKKIQRLILLICLLLLTAISCKDGKSEFKIVGSFENVHENASTIDYFVYVKHFKDEPNYWEAMDSFAKSKKDDKILYQVFNFIYNETSKAEPKSINVEEFRDKYAEQCIYAYHIVQGVSDNMAVKYPYRDQPDKSGKQIDTKDRTGQGKEAEPLVLPVRD